MRTALAGTARTILLCILVPTTVGAQMRGVEPADYYRMTLVGDVAVSPGR